MGSTSKVLFIAMIAAAHTSGCVSIDDVMNSTKSGGTVDPVTVANELPVANAGADQTITLPTTSTTISGSATDSDGTIATYAWTKVSGGAATLGGPTTSTLSLTGLVAGSYTFRLTVTDDAGDVGNDEVTVTVNTAANVLPTASAGVDKTVTLPTSSVALTGSGADSDGTISAYAWTQVSGGSATLSGASTATLALTNLAVGTYVFKLTVTDSSGGTADDTATVTVNAAANAAPTVNAGTDKTITLPTTSVILSGSAADSDGTISTYAWTKVSGAAATLGGASTATLSLSGLAQGAYVFRLTVTDNAGATSSDDANVTVNPASAPGLTANAGADRLVTTAAATYGSALSITGSGTVTVGTITGYAWTQLTGSTVSLGGAATATLTLASGSLGLGDYAFRLTVTSSTGATATDDVTVTVNAAPVVSVSGNQTMTLPTNSATITGSATDSDGTVSAYLWTKVSGPSATLTNATTTTLSVSGLTTGSYVFRLRATDNDGGTATKDMRIIVYTTSANYDYAVNNYIKKASGVPGHLVRFPAGYQPMPGKRSPLLIFMHGLGQVGNGENELYKQEDEGLPQVMKNAAPGWNDSTIPMIVMSPQIPSGFDWDWCINCIKDAYDYAIANYNVDPNRVYLTGLSLGGRGVMLAMKDTYLAPRIAGGIPISTGTNPAGLLCDEVKDIGVWVFHGTSDGTFNIGQPRGILAAVNQCKIPGYQLSDATIAKTDSRARAFPSSSTAFSAGWDTYYGYPSATNLSAATLTLWDGVGHSGWNEVYANRHGGISFGKDGQSYTDVYRWLLTFSLDGTPYTP